MQSNTDLSILDEALACIGQRLASIFIQPAEKDEMYITSLHNEVLAAAWIIGVLSSSGSSPDIPEPVRIAFRSFSDIKNPKTYAKPDESLLLQAGSETSIGPKFNLTEWWKITEGENLSKPFDIGEELVAGLLCALETRITGAELRAKTMANFKEVLRQRREIESRIGSLKSFLENESQRCDEEADRLDHLDGSSE